MSDSILDWIENHDERWSFIILYVGGAVVLSIFMSLFWVAALMLAHFAMEVWRHRMLEQKPVLMHAFWHTKLDFGLILMAFAVSVYLEVIVGALGLGQAARGAQAVARFGVIQRSIRSVLLTIDEAALFLKAFVRGRAARAAEGIEIDTAEEVIEIRSGIEKHVEMVQEAAPWKKPTRGDWFSLGFAALCILMIILGPFFTSHSLADIGNILVQEMKP